MQFFVHPQNIAELTKDAYICIARCKQNIDEILSFIPSEWGIDNSAYKQLLLDKLFEADWIQNSEKRFFEYLHKANNT